MEEVEILFLSINFENQNASAKNWAFVFLLRASERKQKLTKPIKPNNFQENICCIQNEVFKFCSEKPIETNGTMPMLRKPLLPLMSCWICREKLHSLRTLKGIMKEKE